MTSAIPAAPSGLAEDLYHSAPMVLVRYPIEESFVPGWVPKGLTMKALVLALFCATLAFLLSATRERKLIPGAPAVHAPIVPEQQTRAAERTPAPQPQRLVIPERPDRKITEFRLAPSPEFQSLGTVKLRITALNAERGSYNLAVRIRGREFTRKNVKVKQAVKLHSGRKATAPEIVVGAIVQNRAWGYLSEPKATPAAGRARRRFKL
ncbi:MAG TPA: hypothetical protein VH369_26415 [Bryobacteraceae bacterium]|jgi:hypothetical protein